MTAAVKAAKAKANFVIVSMHSGTEYAPRPNKRQQQFARAAIDSGAELVLGHHPHVVQTAEIYKGKYIFYSLGNFVFDQMWSRQTREGLMLKIIFNKDGIVCHSCDLPTEASAKAGSRNPVPKIEYQPVLIYDYAQPRILTGKAAAKVLARLKLPAHLTK
jgi:poly-gamma-glutamate capsule biosynthesis protein CapA/YwtB (metallophosphatase superfamily)